MNYIFVVKYCDNKHVLSYYINPYFIVLTNERRRVVGGLWDLWIALYI